MKSKPPNNLIAAYVVRSLAIIGFTVCAWNLIMFAFEWITLMMLFLSASLLHLPISKFQSMLGKDVKQIAASFNKAENNDQTVDERILSGVAMLILLFILLKNAYYFLVPA